MRDPLPQGPNQSRQAACHVRRHRAATLRRAAARRFRSPLAAARTADDTRASRCRRFKAGDAKPTAIRYCRASLPQIRGQRDQLVRRGLGAPSSAAQSVRWEPSVGSSDLRAASRGRVSVGDEPAGELFSRPATIVPPRRRPRLRMWASRPRLGRQDYGRDAYATVHDFGIIPDAGYLPSLFGLGRFAWRNLLIVSRLQRFMSESS